MSPTTATETVTLSHDENDELNYDTEIPGVLFFQSLSFKESDSNSQLSAPQTNNTDERFRFRQIISENVSTIKLQAKVLRPLIVGTYREQPACFLTLQFRFIVPASGTGVINRISAAYIKVVLKDAPVDSEIQDPAIFSRRRKRTALQNEDVDHPSFVAMDPGPTGFRGPPSTVAISNNTGLKVGASGLGVSITWNQTSARDVARTATIKTLIHGGRHENLLDIDVEENPNDKDGVPDFILVPMIFQHHSRRFSMRVTVDATFGCWFGKLPMNIQILGSSDEPLYCDPVRLKDMMDSGGTRIGGIPVVEQGGDLEKLDLKMHSSLTDNNGIEQRLQQETKEPQPFI